MINKGNFLVATNLLNDSYFENSIVFLVDYSEEGGAYGLIINKVCPMPVNEVFTEANIPFRGTYPFFMGGPVDEDLVQILHLDSEPIEDPQEIIPKVFMGKSFRESEEDKIEESALEKIFLGYSGWSPGQLEDELDQKCWQVYDVDPITIFSQEHNFFSILTPDSFRKLSEDHES